MKLLKERNCSGRESGADGIESEGKRGTPSKLGQWGGKKEKTQGKKESKTAQHYMRG